jgi:hypothetical protein
MRALKFCGIALASGLVVGALGGAYVGNIIGTGQSILWQLSAEFGYEQFAHLQFEQADVDHSRQALVSYADFSKSMSQMHPGDNKFISMETGRNYLRLAAIEQAAGYPGLSHQYVLKAQEAFKSVGRDISEEALDKQVAKIVSSAPLTVPSS